MARKVQGRDARSSEDWKSALGDPLLLCRSFRSGAAIGTCGRLGKMPGRYDWIHADIPTQRSKPIASSTSATRSRTQCRRRSFVIARDARRHSSRKEGESARRSGVAALSICFDFYPAFLSMFKAVPRLEKSMLILYCSCNKIHVSDGS